MKYIMLLLFNAVSFYILAVFIFGGGGIRDNLQKLEHINRLEEECAKSELEVEELTSRLKTLESQNIPDASSLAKQGKKSGNTVIFKYLEKQDRNIYPERSKSFFTYYRIYFITAFSIFFILLGDMLICLNLAGRPLT
jgi:cell division protein FtsB